MTHPNQWTIINYVLKKELISTRRFDKFMKGVILTITCVFMLALLQKSVICWLNLSLESNLTPKSFSQSLFFSLKVFTFKLTSWLVLTIKWHLSALPFERLFSNHPNRDTEARWRDSITNLFPFNNNFSFNKLIYKKWCYLSI